MQKNHTNTNACKFCMIAQGKLPAVLMYEDSKVVVIKNKYPKCESHFLVIPKMHLVCLRDNQSSAKQEIISYIFNNMEKFANRCNLIEFTTTVHNGATVGQSEFHLHVHITNNDISAFKP